MAKQDYNQRQLFIIGILRNRSCTFKEINGYLIRQGDVSGNPLEISASTFQRDRKDIYTTWGIDISYDQREKVYRINEEDKEEHFERLYEAFDTVSAFKKCETMGEHIYLEKRKSKGTDYFNSILHAIQNKLVVTFKLDSYWQESSVRRCVPKAIKEAQNRYYLIAYDLDKKEIRNYGLDRISELQVLTKSQVTPPFNVKKHYQHAFGIECYDEPQKVILKIDQSQLKYVKSLPFHASQKITNVSEDTFTVELFIHPTNDFVMEVMRHGSNCEIVSPLYLRDWIKKNVEEMYELYHSS